MENLPLQKPRAVRSCQQDFVLRDPQQKPLTAADASAASSSSPRSCWQILEHDVDPDLHQSLSRLTRAADQHQAWGHSTS